jgi:hypothetical protein
MKKIALFVLTIIMPFCAYAANEVTGVKKLNPTTVEVYLTNSRTMTFDFYGDNIFRLFQDNSGGIIRDPEAKPAAKILVDNPRHKISKLVVTETGNQISIQTEKMNIVLDKSSSLFKVINLKTNAEAFELLAPATFEKDKVSLTLKENPQEYFYGGGVQNGRFSHKGKKIAIENQNSWTDGGVASPAPFYWSTNGYGVMCYTFGMGKYDFGAIEKGKVTIMHETNYLDVFFMVDDGAVALLNDYYQLTGNPVLLPKFAFYEGHLNAYNRDYWKADDKGILFEDGKRYKESQKDNGGIKESLNGEKNNYQFSARAVIDRYKNHDMPLGWILPNDGYGAGYGQTETLDGNIQNLKSLGDYARKNGVEIGLWTQSDLHPKAGISALLQRDIVKEVRDAGVRVLKTDVAWVGDGYSFGLNGVSDVAHIMPYYGNDARPFIISLDGWAGTQRYAGVWTGDQTGGEWEYIRFHIPTYVGSGLSGIPNITSDMDGIFGGRNMIINARDFQWKTFTPMQLNMDGWGYNEKYPHALGEPATSINRNYLKFKSELIPYTYSIAKEAVSGLPIIRAMFLQYPNEYTKGADTEYQYMYGPYFLVAPVYQSTKSDTLGNDIRNGIYLPEGKWIDYFTGEMYSGNTILNNFAAPLWKLPLFVKAGAIIPMANPNNHVSEINKSLRIYTLYPYGKSMFTEYDDDGISEAYKAGVGATTLIESNQSGSHVNVTVYPAKGSFNGMIKTKATEFRLNVTAKPQSLSATIGKNKVSLREVKTITEFDKAQNVYFYQTEPDFNRFATKGSDFAKTKIIKNPMLFVKLASTDITANAVKLFVNGFAYAPVDRQRVSTGKLTPPANAQVSDENTKAYTLKPTWDKVANADYYELQFNGNLYSTIKDTQLLFERLTPLTSYTFKLRAVNKTGVSDWVEFKAKTKINPLEYAIHGIHGEVTCADQEGFEVSHLFDFAESGDVWHTKYRVNALPFDMIIDLRSINTLDRFEYLPRLDAGNGTLMKGTVSYSMDKEHWTDAGAFDWKRNGDTKTFTFANHPTVRYIKLSVTEGANKYGSGRELYVFKVPGSTTILPGDVNNDGKIDNNDLTSYMNYTGLRKGDPDFDGYISKGDINLNGLIDAYDISVVATQIDGGIGENAQTQKLSGSISISVDKEVYKKDDEVNITVKGTDLKAVNAFGFALPYDKEDYDFVGVQPMNVKQMENMTYDRLHKDGSKSVYPTFVNVGDKETLKGSSDLLVIKLKAKRKVKFDLKVTDGMLVDKYLNVVKF